jgi:hypothetical protein
MGMAPAVKLQAKINKSALFLTIILILCSVYPCSGQLAKPGWARVLQIMPNGAILLHYPDGKTEWKLIPRDKMPDHAKIAAKWMLVPARYVETKKQGSTLTFPNGDTIIYQNFPKD